MSETFRDDFRRDTISQGGCRERVPEAVDADRRQPEAPRGGVTPGTLSETKHKRRCPVARLQLGG